MGRSTSSGQPFFGLRGGKLNLWITVACGSTMMFASWDQAVFSTLIISDNFLNSLHLQGRINLISIITAIHAIGCVVGAMLAFLIGERFGRRQMIWIGTSFASSGIIMIATCSNLGDLFAGRVFSGIGNGIAIATAPLWQAETAPSKWRSRLVMLDIWFNIAGFTMVNWINYGMFYIDGAFSWRFPLAIQCVFVIVIYVTVKCLPESPRWLLRHDELDQAHTTISCLEDKDMQDPYVLAQLKEIQSSIQYESERSKGLGENLKSESTQSLRRLTLGVGIQFFSQLGGINIMAYFLPSILIAQVGLFNQTARLITGINATTSFLSFTIVIFLIDRWGRRTLMLISTTGQGLTFLIIAILFKYASDGYEKCAKATIPFFFIYYISFTMGMAGIPWLYSTEINSIAMKTKGVAAASAANWLGSYAVTQMTPYGIKNLGWKYWIIFAIFNIAFIPIIYSFYPETANRTLEDMDQYYRNNPPPLVTKDKATINPKRPQEYITREKEAMREISGDDDVIIVEDEILTEIDDKEQGLVFSNQIE